MATSANSCFALLARMMRSRAVECGAINPPSVPARCERAVAESVTVPAVFRQPRLGHRGRKKIMINHPNRKLVSVHYVVGGDCCAECCERVAALARDGQRVGIRLARQLDAAVGACEWGCDPMQSHRYGDDDDCLEDAFR